MDDRKFREADWVPPTLPHATLTCTRGIQRYTTKYWVTLSLLPLSLSPIFLLHHSLTHSTVLPGGEFRNSAKRNGCCCCCFEIDRSFSGASIDLITKGGRRNGLDSLGDSLPSPTFRLHLAFQLQWRSEDLRPLSLPLQRLLLSYSLSLLFFFSFRKNWCSSSISLFQSAASIFCLFFNNYFIFFCYIISIIIFFNFSFWSYA